MLNPTLASTIAQSARRSEDAARLRKKADETDFDTVSDIGGPWDGVHQGTALRALERGWGGWNDTSTPPWEPQHDLTMTGLGGIYTRERHRETVAGISWQSHVGGNRDVEIGGDCSLEVEDDLTVNVAGALDIRVHGNADWSAHDKLIMAAGTLHRHWEGSILRMIGMEGVIVGGAFLKTFTGCSMTMAPLASGDVYGGCAQISASRTRMAATMGYRSTEMCAWQCLAYVRACNILLEPIAGTPLPDKPWGPKMRNLIRAGRIGMGICPLLDILVGVLMAPVGIALAIRARVKKKAPAPPAGPPRIHQRSAAVITQTRASDKIL